jgi:hypothetical protein
MDKVPKSSASLDRKVCENGSTFAAARRDTIGCNEGVFLLQQRTLRMATAALAITIAGQTRADGTLRVQG